ncbi:hypothetical protein H2200_012334 [Cladophialophora chaetospira]|uniref:DUF1754-domain-containing protein n=1 Tax=Cladophialophora chaetospira TaxID=386627 RepID=A0AA38WXP1_9EURO|nr:hypothetical protein H2200_012334 [Cladophialophora chaetospira]
MAPSDAYASAGSGKLKLKGVKDSKVDKKKKKKSSLSKQKEDEEGAAQGEFKDRSVMLKKLEEEDAALAGEEGRSLQKRESGTRAEGDERQDEEESGGEVFKTEAEKRYEEQRRKRLEERLKREGVKTHKERVEELNRYLSGLSEHHDMPRIGPG